MINAHISNDMLGTHPKGGYIQLVNLCAFSIQSIYDSIIGTSQCGGMDLLRAAKMILPAIVVVIMGLVLLCLNLGDLIGLFSFFVSIRCNHQSGRSYRLCHCCLL